MTGNGRALAEASDHTHEHGKVAAQGPALEDSRPRHRHHGHGRGHGHHHHHAVGEGVSLRSLVVLGITGGIVPCPAALVVLLSAMALHRIGFGLVLIAAFSAGLAAVLIAIGLLVVYARRVMGRFRGEGPLISRWLPLASAVVITALGIAIALRSLGAVGSL